MITEAPNQTAITDLLTRALIDPVDGTRPVAFPPEGGELVFQGGNRYPCPGGAPVLIDERASLFQVADVVAKVATTQDRGYRDRESTKNFIRQRVLPPLSRDSHYARRIAALAAEVDDAPVLILGAGDKVETYRRAFPHSVVVTTDVHIQFGSDLVCDVHKIPFADGTFGLVLADQVLEHVVRPWVASAEMERVTRPGGLIYAATPFAFPHHAYPYDFHRFTATGLRFLFPHSELMYIRATEGPASAAAVFLSSTLIDLSGRRRVRWLALAAGRLLLWPLKYLDRLNRSRSHLQITAAKGLVFVGRRDGRRRSDRELIDEVRGLVRS
jgi:SAM-dependent methyltransferase